MTTCSTVAALGMMPLCLYLYTLSWNLEENLTIPYQNIGITLVCLTIPVAFGAYVNYRWPEQSRLILKVGAIVGGVLLLVVAVAGVVLAKGSWNSDTMLLTISFIFPLIGHIMGFLLALLTHQSWQRCWTISLETGAQNIQMCITMLQLSFTAEQLVQMLNFPLAYGLFQLLDGFLIVAVYKMYKRRLKNKHRKKHPHCAEACCKKKPKETSAFLEVIEEAALTPGPSGPVDLTVLSSQLAASHVPNSELLLRKESHLLPVRSHTHRSGVLCISWYRLLPSDNLSSSGAGPSKSSHSGLNVRSRILNCAVS